MYPTCMRKTSIYLSDQDAERLRRLADRHGCSQADVVRTALEVYERVDQGDRSFAVSGVFAGSGSSIADIPDDELLRGFGT